MKQPQIVTAAWVADRRTGRRLLVPDGRRSPPGLSGALWLLAFGWRRRRSS